MLIMARNFLWDPIEDNVIAEFDDDHNLIVEYTTEPEPYGDVISQHRDGETNCFYSDGLGSTTEVTNAAGDTIATRAYGSFGETTEQTGGLDFAFQFKGQLGFYYDSVTGLYYVRDRQYAPLIARWLSIERLSQRWLPSNESYISTNPILSEPPGFTDAFLEKIAPKDQGTTCHDNSCKMIGFYRIEAPPTGKLLCTPNSCEPGYQCFEDGPGGLICIACKGSCNGLEVCTGKLATAIVGKRRAYCDCVPST